MPKELAQAYKLIADLLSYPEQPNLEKRLSLSQEVTSSLAQLIPEATDLIRHSVQDLNSLRPEQYVDIFELSPKCPLYLGYYGFEEPATCASAGTSERNQLMMEMANIYRHYGLSLEDKELPDFLPAVVEFLWLTCDSEERVPRCKLISEFVLPYLPKIAQRLAGLHSAYANLLNALEQLLKYELSVNEEEAYA